MKIKKPRPHVWKVQGEIPHQQFVAWQRMRAQANFRKEAWTLTFEEFQEIWQPYWHLRGRASRDYCLTRWDYDLPWDRDNTVCMERREHLKRSVAITRGTQ